MNEDFPPALWLCLVLAFCPLGCGPVDSSTEQRAATTRTGTIQHAEVRQHHIESTVVHYTVKTPSIGLALMGTAYYERPGGRIAWYERGEFIEDGVSKKIDRMNLLNGKEYHLVDLARKVHYKIVKPVLKIGFRQSATEGLSYLKEYEREMANRRHWLSLEVPSYQLLHQAGTEQVAHKECELWERAGMSGVSVKFCLWNSIILKAETLVDGRPISTMLATNVEERMAVPAEKFAVPANLKTK